MFEWCTHFFLVLASTCRSRSRRSSSGDLTFSLQGCHRVHAKCAPMIRMVLWYSAEILCEMMWNVLFNQLTKMMSFFGGERIATTSLGPQIFWYASMDSKHDTREDTLEKNARFEACVQKQALRKASINSMGPKMHQKRMSEMPCHHVAPCLHPW